MLTLHWKGVLPANVPEAGAEAIAVEFHYDNDVEVRARRLTLTPRHGRTQVLSEAVLAPGRFEPLPERGSIELHAMALVDLAQGEASLRLGESGSRLLLPASMGPEEQHGLLRLFLDYEPAP
jgi:hypothetical protein